MEKPTLDQIIRSVLSSSAIEGIYVTEEQLLEGLGMPLKKCTKNGKPGWKWGDSGVCYTGPDAKEKAMKQGKAIEASKSEKKGK